VYVFSLPRFESADPLDAHFIPTVVSQPTLLFLTSGGPTWSRQDCLNRNITTLSADRGALTPRGQSLNADTLKQNAQASPFLEQFTFLKDPDGALLSRRFATLAPMAQVCNTSCHYLRSCCGTEYHNAYVSLTHMRLAW
jgi:hypothetical protein